MNPFQEAFQKGLGEGLAKWTLRGIATLLSSALGVFLLGYPITAVALLAVATILIFLLAAYVFGWVTSYRKMRERICELEKRDAAIQAKFSDAEWHEFCEVDSAGNVGTRKILAKKSSNHDT